jgi:23S rRNA (cytidine2498-2'-O)-methyltransferase
VPLLTPLPGRVYEAVRGFEDHLLRELSPAARPLLLEAADSPILYYDESEPGEDAAGEAVFWAQNVWTDPFRLDFASISEAAAALRALQRNWAGVFQRSFRRGALIGEKLPPLPSRPRPFPWPLPDAAMGAFTLLDDHTLIGSAACSSPFPRGRIEFIEDKEGPPSRAYLKLWEALTLARTHPQPGMRCLDAGASPGGWTWALSRLGAEVLAVDRAPLDPRIAALPGVRTLRHDAFTLKPQDIGAIDWLFCDVICYPERLLRWIEAWLESGLCGSFVCTLKMQGQGSLEIPRLFAALPGSRVLHLWHNKHELTFLPRQQARQQAHQQAHQRARQRVS